MRQETAVDAPGHGSERRGHLRLSLHRLNQLFNSLDPSPFYEKDLDEDAERFLVSWATELHPHADLRLTLYLRERPDGADPEKSIAHAIHHYFAERARLVRGELFGMLRQGRLSLAIGVTFLTVCMLLARFIEGRADGITPRLLSEGLTIVGWVAMWRPLQIYLYDWWPLRARVRLYRRLAQMPVELRIV